jgi:hypothetical protein
VHALTTLQVGISYGSLAMALRSCLILKVYNIHHDHPERQNNAKQGKARQCNEVQGNKQHGVEIAKQASSCNESRQSATAQIKTCNDNEGHRKTTTTTPNNSARLNKSQ